MDSQCEGLIVGQVVVVVSRLMYDRSQYSKRYMINTQSQTHIVSIREYCPPNLSSPSLLLFLFSFFLQFTSILFSSSLLCSNLFSSLLLFPPLIFSPLFSPLLLTSFPSSPLLFSLSLPSSSQPWGISCVALVSYCLVTV